MKGESHTKERGLAERARWGTMRVLELLQVEAFI
jgi:hypothetical protein